MRRFLVILEALLMDGYTVSLLLSPIHLYIHTYLAMRYCMHAFDQIYEAGALPIKNININLDI